MTELDRVKGEKVMLSIGGRERELKYSFSVWAVIEKEIGGLDNLEKLEEKVEKFPFQTIPHLIYIGLVDKEGVEESTVLDEYGLGDIEMITKVFETALYGSLPDSEKKAVKEAK